MWPLSSCHSASSHKISPKSENLSMSYGHKSDFQDGGRRHLEFQKFQFLVTWLRSGSPFAVVYLISSKSDNFSLRYGDLTISKMAGVRHLGFKNLQFFCHVALVDMPFCFLVQNFAEIGKIGWWVMVKKAIFKMTAATAILNFKNFNFWSRDCCRVQYLM